MRDGSGRSSDQRSDGAECSGGGEAHLISFVG
jgi:hypothetical protein